MDSAPATVAIPRNWLWGLAVMMLVYVFGLPLSMMRYHNSRSPAAVTEVKLRGMERDIDRNYRMVRSIDAAGITVRSNEMSRRVDRHDARLQALDGRVRRHQSDGHGGSIPGRDEPGPQSAAMSSKGWERDNGKR